MRSQECICKCKSAKEVLKGTSCEGLRFSILQCSNCGLRRTSEILGSEDYVKGFSNLNNIVVDDELNFRMKFDKEMMDEIIKLKKSGKLLDIGCYIGSFVKLGNKNGFESEGIDLNTDAVRIGKRLGLRLHIGDFVTYPFKEQSYDVVIMSCVLEHISDPVPFIGKVYSLLKPNGILGITEPNCDGLLAKLLRTKWYAWTPNENLWHFSKRTLISSMKIIERRFKLIKAKTTNLDHGSKNPALNFILQIPLTTIRELGMGDKTIVLMQK